MKLLYITNGINGSGGLERVLSIKASYLVEAYNYEVLILTLNENSIVPFYQFSNEIKFKSIQVGGHPIKYFKTYKRGIQELINQFKPDVISVCDDGLKGFFIPRIIKTDARIIYERHVSKQIEVKSKQGVISSLVIKVKWKMMSILAQKFSKFIVLTEDNKKEWTSLKNIKVISNPLSFYPDESSTLENKVIICVGKISYQKGQDLLVKAWDLVFENYPDWKLKLYGYANESFLNTTSLVTKNIFYYPPEQNIIEKYLNSSVYVMSSRFEGFGMVLIEAMACGVPCVSFDCNYGPANIIHDGYNGLLVEIENVESLASSLIRLIKEDDLRKSMGKNAKKSVSRYAPENIVKEWHDLFTEILNK